MKFANVGAVLKAFCNICMATYVEHTWPLWEFIHDKGTLNTLFVTTIPSNENKPGNHS